MSGSGRPPRFAEALLRFVAPAEDADVLLDELRDEFARETSRRGERAARAWFAREVLRSLGPVLTRRLRLVNRKPRSRGGSMDGWTQDVRFGARMLSKNPGFAAVAVLTLALGIGANTAVFSVINAVLLRPLPFPSAEQLVALGQTEAKNREGLAQFSFRNFADLRAQTRALDQLAAYYNNSVTLTGQGEAVRLRGVVATASLFPLLGAAPARGRTFLPEEDNPGGGPQGYPAILSFQCWQQQFGGDPQIVGRAISLDGSAYTVVGVMPRTFSFPVQAQPAEVWISPARDAEKAGEGAIMVARGYRGWRVIGRLKDGASVDQAQAEANVVASNLAALFPDANHDLGIKVMPLREWLVGNQRLTLLLLLGTVSVVLLIACSNVAHLLLERAVRRRREITVRLALGASRFRVARQLATEILMLALAAGVVGSLLATWGTSLLISLSPGGIPRIMEARLDARVLGFTALVSLVTGVLFGLAPALGASRVGLAEALREGGRSGAGGPRSARARHLLIVAEVGLALVLLVGAGLLVRTLGQMQSVPLGFDPRNILTMSIARSPGSDVETGEFFRQLTERVRELPGVAEASVTWQLPLSGAGASTSLNIEGRPDDPGNVPTGVLHSAAPGYFKTMGIPVLSGRDFTDHDDLKSAPVLIVNQTLAKRYFSGEAVGKRLMPGYSTSGTYGMREIVGVVGDVKHQGLTGGAVPEFYFAQAQMPVNSMTLVVRTVGDPHVLAASVRKAVQAMDGNAPVFSVLTVEEYMSRAVAPTRFTMTLLAAFAVVALLMTAVGLYGVISFTVSQSTRDLGIRIALGAQPRDTLRLVMGKGLLLTMEGVVLGLIVAFALSRVMAGLLFGVGATDPATYMGVALLLVAVAALACYVPARRATRVDPVVALRAD